MAFHVGEQLVHIRQVAAGLFCMISARLGQQLRISNVLEQRACPARDRGLDTHVQENKYSAGLAVGSCYPGYLGGWQCQVQSWLQSEFKDSLSNLVSSHLNKKQETR